MLLDSNLATKTDLANTEARLIKWIVGIVLTVATAQTALFFGLVKFAL
ncbi:hypothetical protein [Candidatus Spongiihabitans sp.]